MCELPELDYMSKEYEEALIFLSNGGSIDFIKQFFNLSVEVETRLITETQPY